MVINRLYVNGRTEYFGAFEYKLFTGGQFDDSVTVMWSQAERMREAAASVGVCDDHSARNR